jgi:hypothetical protein
MDEQIGEEKITELELYSLRIITGEKVVGPFSFDKDNKTFVVFYPIVIKRYYDEEAGGVRTVFEKLDEESDQTFSIISEPHVVTVSPLNSSFRDFYVKAVSKFYYNKKDIPVNTTFAVEGTNSLN